MATIHETLVAISAYPIPARTIESIGLARGVDFEDEATQETMQSREYKLACADIKLWLSEAPNISQGGQSFTFSDEQRKRLRNEAMAEMQELDDNTPKATYGYKGTRL